MSFFHLAIVISLLAPFGPGVEGNCCQTCYNTLMDCIMHCAIDPQQTNRTLCADNCRRDTFSCASVCGPHCRLNKNSTSVD
ncbi:hypothetical protein GPALN_006919 [Globodera pallida]|nr:hypothetical protein GPALN_006919 [Globodera pallida]